MVVMNELIFNMFLLLWGSVVVVNELISITNYFGQDEVLKKLKQFLTLGGCGGLERTDF